MKINKKEIARDFMALGSIPFLILILIRIITAGNFKTLSQIVFAVLLLFLASLKLKDINYHSAIFTILVIFTSLFYMNIVYTILVFLVLIIGFYGMKKYLKKKKIYISMAIGIVCSIISYLIELSLKIPNL